MLNITVGGIESFDDAKQEFVIVAGIDLELEHSLASLSKWESKHEIPFLDGKEKTQEQTRDYVYEMIVTPNVSPEILQKFSQANFDAVNEHITKKMTATWFKEPETPKNNGEIITAELIYYWMVELKIPFECQYWHLNKLLTLVKVCNEKNKPPEKVDKAKLYADRAALNERRRLEMGTNG